MRLMIFLLNLVLLFSCKAQLKQPVLPANADDNSLLWEISGNGLAKKSYLFGTFHLMCKDDIRFSNQLKSALASSNKIYMELDMDDPAVMLGGMMLMTMKDGKTLQDFYSKEEFNKLNQFFKDSLHTPLAMMQSLKPFFLIAMLYPKMMPCKKISGVEEELMKLAKADKKEIVGLETMEFQAAVFDSIPYQEQAKELLKSIDSIASYAKYFDTMVTVYKNQQLGKMGELFNNSEFGMQEHQDILLDNRNKHWVEKLKSIMKKESVFVAVGAGHLPGEKGLITLLKKVGYTVRPILNK